MTRHFANNDNGSRLYSRRLFEGMFLGMGVKGRFLSERLMNIGRESDVVKDHCHKLVGRCVSLTKQYMSIIEEIARRRPDWKKVGTSRLVMHVKEGGGTTEHPCGGHILRSSDSSMVGELRKCCDRAKFDIDGRTIFSNYDPKALLTLSRFKRSQGVGAHSTFYKPLMGYMDLCGMSSGTAVSLDLLHIVLRCVLQIEFCCIENGVFPVIDDIVRQFLSEIDKETFLYCQVDENMSQVFTNVHGLATMGGPRGWTKESVDESIKDWVCGKRVFNYEKIPFVNDKLVEWMDSWCAQSKPDGFLTFEEFVTDPMRWATGGGAKRVKVSIQGEELDVRNKWMWAIAKLRKGENLIESAKSEGLTARVALKEEVKTRCVITTPQMSYLRQCYMLYRLGDPKFLKSTIVDKGLTRQLVETTESHFVCVDASQFDHTVSKEFVIRFFSMIRDRVDRDLAQLIQQEIDDLEKLDIEFNGIKYNYENGLLSGWRVTSLIGSLLSALLCEYINYVIGRKLLYVTQGDDIIMRSRSKLDKRLILKCCEDFGIKTNEKKTTIGRFGEFLKYRYGNGHVQGYAARAVRSVYYANPWLDTTIVQSPGEVAQKWFMIMSRIMNSANGTFLSSKSKIEFEKSVVEDVHGWIGREVSKKTIQKCLYTPVSFGGLGVFEWSKFSVQGARTLDKIDVLEKTTFEGDDRFLELFGGPKDKKYIGKEKNVKTSTLSVVYKYLVGKAHGYITNTSRTVGELKFGDQYNIFRTIMMELGSCKTRPPIVAELLAVCQGAVAMVSRPKFLIKSNRWYDILQWMTGKDLKHSCPPSMFVDNRYDSGLGRSLQSIASLLYYNLPNVTAASKMAMAFMAYDIFLRGPSFLHAL